MMDQTPHTMLPQPTHDELARESFVGALRRFAVAEMYPAIKTVYERDQLPQFRSRAGRAPETYAEVRALLESDAYFQSFSLVTRATQELLWDTVGESVERQLETLVSRARTATAGGGTLTLDPALVTPAHIRAVDIHVMPGNYHTELGAEDVFAGALYDRGVYLYAYGGLGVLNDALGVETAKFVRERFPSLRPTRILDVGCGVGHSTLPLVKAFAGAEVYGIDVAAPMLRYGHARADALRQRVHFSQQDATQTTFPDGHFDLIMSCLLLHELPMAVITGIIEESHRLLAPGGVMVHNDMLGWPKEPFADFMTDWNTIHNNEPFSRNIGSIDFLASCEAAGFVRDDVFIGGQKAAYMEEQLETMGLRGAVKR